MKKIILILLITLLLTIHIKPHLSFSMLKEFPCSCEDSNDPACQLEHKRHDQNAYIFWTDENINLLDEQQKKELDKLQRKINSGSTLTTYENEEMLMLTNSVIKIKLGNDDYIIFKDLLDKKDSGAKLTKDDIKKLRFYFKKII